MGGRDGGFGGDGSGGSTSAEPARFGSAPRASVGEPREPVVSGPGVDKPGTSTKGTKKRVGVVARGTHLRRMSTSEVLRQCLEKLFQSNGKKKTGRRGDSRSGNYGHRCQSGHEFRSGDACCRGQTWRRNRRVWPREGPRAMPRQSGAGPDSLPRLGLRLAPQTISRKHSTLSLSGAQCSTFFLF